MEEKQPIPNRKNAPVNQDPDQPKIEKAPDQPEKKHCRTRHPLRTAGWILAAFLLLICGLIFSIWYTQARTALPDDESLRIGSPQFSLSELLDWKGTLLGKIINPGASRTDYISLDQVSPYLIAAEIATEDKGFFLHAGFDPAAIFRAFMENLRSRATVSGASTITEQLAKNTLIPENERYERVPSRKIKEIFLSAAIERRYTKDQILELYINEMNYGNNSFGIVQAAWNYFGTTPDKLDLAQASFLAGMPQAPYGYDIFTNRTGALQRQKTVLMLMEKVSREQDGIRIDMKNRREKVRVDKAAADAAAEEIAAYAFK